VDPRKYQECVQQNQFQSLFYGFSRPPGVDQDVIDVNSGYINLFMYDQVVASEVAIFGDPITGTFGNFYTRIMADPNLNNILDVGSIEFVVQPDPINPGFVVPVVTDVSLTPYYNTTAETTFGITGTQTVGLSTLNYTSGYQATFYYLKAHGLVTGPNACTA
jgi:hypothetical protein